MVNMMIMSMMMQDNAEPVSDLSLEWVHGHRCYDCRGTVLYTKPTKDLVRPS
jgi:hypothetical protein